MRIGISPSRNEMSPYSPARVTVAVLVSIPNDVGYYFQRFDVLKICLGSIVKNTDVPYDLLVFDNGSSAEVRKYLSELNRNGTIQYLMLANQNIGKIGALKIIFSAAPGEIVAYSDDDIFFYPEWLSPQLKIFDAFPRVGMVSGCPVREQFKYGNKYLREVLDNSQTLRVEYGQFIPDSWNIDFKLSTGRSLERDENEPNDIILHNNEISAYATATHFQFVALKQTILNVLNTGELRAWSGRKMGQMREMDEMVEEQKYLRLSTMNRYVRHIGNVLTPEIKALASQFGIRTKARVVSQASINRWRWFISIPRVRKIVERTYNLTYRLLNS